MPKRRKRRGQLAPRDTARFLLHVAWMAIVVGLILQFSVSAIAAALGTAWPSVAVFIRDASQKVTWSSLVCLGLALGNAVARAPIAWTGMAGLLAAPTGFIVARTVQKGVGSAMGAAAPGMLNVVFWSLLILKSGQYAVFGALLAYIAMRPWGGFWTHVGVGAASGVLFGLSALAINVAHAAQAPPTGVLVGQALNEVMFPVGCAVVIYLAGMMSRIIPAESKE